MPEHQTYTPQRDQYQDVEISLVEDAIGGIFAFITQLPPVGRDDRGELIAGRPDVFLTEVHRHSRDNPLVQLSMMARVGQPLAPGQYGQSLVAQAADIEGIMGCGADQILCGTNKTRRRINDAVRARDGRTHWYPEPGERLVCLTNWHRRGLLNGSIWVVRGVAFGQSRYTREPLIQLDIVPEDGGSMRRVPVPINSFDHHFDYAYALTVHKSQGSQWDSVVVIDEARALKYALGIDPKRWRYTAITRAAKAALWVKRLVTE
jgi:exodeoxyribonuclease-5